MLVTAKKWEEPIIDVEEVCWDEVRDEVYKVNLELAEICDSINPGKQHTLLKIKYPYGSKIVDKGVFNLPLVNTELLSINDRSMPFFLREKLTYCSIPLSVILDNNTEVFVEARGGATPLNFFKPGDLFGVFESMDFLTDNQSSPIWSVTAGARSAFMVPRITDTIGHNRMKKEFGIGHDVPTHLSDQWAIFKDICNHPIHRGKWYNTILVFTDSWFQKNSEEGSWRKFYQYLFKLSWKQLQLLRDVTEFSLLWSSFGDEINNRNLKPRPYLVDTIKHLVSIANGSGVAFKPATDETALPVSIIQNAYMDFYNLKDYIPTVMQPCKLQGKEKLAYYSLAFPTVLESSPFVKNAPSLIEDERDLKRLMETFLRTIKQGDMINPIKHVTYEFFHTHLDQYGEIQESNTILEDDPRFIFMFSERHQSRLFCATSPFFRGCIRISITPEDE